MLSPSDKEIILHSFPNIKLSYENVVHKKVFNSDIILVIPSGIKCFAWFTLFNDEYVCILFELDNNKKQFKNIKIITTCFSSSLCYGTIVYGTLFYHKENSFFSVEDLFLYKGNDFSRENWEKKFIKLSEMFKKDIKQVSYNKSFVIFGIPIMVTNNDEVTNIAKLTNNYKIESIQYIKLNAYGCYQVLSMDEFNNKEVSKNYVANVITDKQENIIANKRENVVNNERKNIILKIKPDIQNDIYHLYCHNDEYYGIAGIPDYKTSVFMNKLFRKIKENDDLDKLEESDDEDEFQNPDIDKFVSLEKAFTFECFFNKRFKKWVPIKQLNENSRLSRMDEVKNAVHKFTSKQNKYYK